MEDQAIAQDAEGFPATLAALMDDEGRFGRCDLTYGEMARRISPKAKVAWDENYGFLSAHAAHPRTRSLQGLSTVSKEGGLLLRPGSTYDEIWVNAVLCHLLNQLILVMETAAKLIASVGGNWQYTGIPAIEAVVDLRQQKEEWARIELGNFATEC